MSAFDDFRVWLEECANIAVGGDYQDGQRSQARVALHKFDSTIGTRKWLDMTESGQQCPAFGAEFDGRHECNATDGAGDCPINQPCPILRQREASRG